MTTHLKTIIFLLGLVVGIATGEVTSSGTEIVLLALVLILIEGGVYMLSIRSRKSLVALIITFFSLGVIMGGIRTQFTEEKTIVVCETSCQIEGVVVRLGDIKETYSIFDVEVNTDSSLVRVRAPLYPEYRVGDRVTLSGKVLPPKNFYPHEEKKSFDYTSYLALKNVGSEMYYPKISPLTKDDVTVKESLRNMHSLFVDRVGIYVTEPASYLASGMLLGVTNFHEELLQMFRTTGLSHIVVLSGFNITILIVFVLLMLRPFPVLVRVGVATFFVVLFVIMVGGGSSLIRASGMAGVALLALLFGRGYVASQALLISLIAIVLYSPESLLHDVSLHLSFLATAGIVYGYSEIKSLFGERLPGWMTELVSATIGAYIATLPYVLYTFGSFSLYAVISNLFVLPFVPVTMSFTALTLLLSFINQPLAYLFGVVTGLLGNTIITVAKVIERLPYALVEMQISFSVMILMYVAIALLFLFLKTRTQNETIETKEGEIISPIMRF